MARHKGNVLFVQGGAKGADTYARRWCRVNGYGCKTERADWDKYGDAAGPIRNRKMIKKYQPHYVIAFIGNHKIVGTADMIKVAKAAGLRVVEIR